MSPARTLLVALAAAATLAGCVTGERPTLAEEVSADTVTGDPATDAVLALLARADDQPFTADYQVTNNFGPITRDARVVRTPEGHRSITVGDVRFLLEGSTTATCNMATASCSETIDDAAVSDMQLTHQFYAASAIDRLRTDSERRVGTTEGYATEIGGRPSTGVRVPVDGGQKVYCAADTGVLASYEGPDQVITLTAYDPAADPEAFTRP